MKKRVLVVERDEDILHIIETILNDQNYLVVSSITEVGVLQLVQEIKPHAIILDVIKPTAEGTLLCKTLKATAATKDIPVIVLSTHFNIEEFKSDCADKVIAKPFDIDELISAIDTQTVA